MVMMIIQNTEKFIIKRVGKMKIVFLAFILASCGSEDFIEDEVTYTEEKPVCWTINGDPNIYYHVLDHHVVDESFYDQCEQLRISSQENN